MWTRQICTEAPLRVCCASQGTQMSTTSELPKIALVSNVLLIFSACARLSKSFVDFRPAYFLSAQRSQSAADILKLLSFISLFFSDHNVRAASVIYPISWKHKSVGHWFPAAQTKSCSCLRTEGWQSWKAFVRSKITTAVFKSGGEALYGRLQQRDKHHENQHRQTHSTYQSSCILTANEPMNPSEQRWRATSGWRQPTNQTGA